jgi:hypothetical protein
VYRIIVHEPDYFAPLGLQPGWAKTFLPLALSPALLFAKLRNMCGVVLPVPLVEKQQPVYGALAIFGVDERSCEVFGL